MFINILLHAHAIMLVNDKKCSSVILYNEGFTLECPTTHQCSALGLGLGSGVIMCGVVFSSPKKICWTQKINVQIFYYVQVTCRAIGIGSYVVRLGQRIVQNENSHIILTGAAALNKVLGQEVYTSNSQLGGIQIMHNNGVTHAVSRDDFEGVGTLLKWLSYMPKVRELLESLVEIMFSDSYIHTFIVYIHVPSNFPLRDLFIFIYSDHVRLSLQSRIVFPLRVFQHHKVFLTPATTTVESTTPANIFS